MTPRAIHLVGIGGAGMSGLARLAAQAGYRVSGTDRDDSDVLVDLRELGVDAHAGHSADAISDVVDTLVVSTAIAPDNPELLAAKERGIPVIHRADLLVELMGRHKVLAVAGAHGKSTTSAMLMLALGGASACIGATVPGGGGTGAVWGDGPWFVAEADESDRSLLKFHPYGAILLNVDHDHHSTYSSITEVEEVFTRFVASLPPDGLLVVGPDVRARDVALAAQCEVRGIATDRAAFCRIEESGSETWLELGDGRRVRLELLVPGRHNRLNAACAIVLADWCGVDPDLAADRLRAFTGVGRRYELRGAVNGVTVVDDYAHHPAEIAATLAAARERHDGRIVAVFQPHLYSRTRALHAELGQALSAADVAVVTEIYAAREPHDASISGRHVVEAVTSEARFAPTLDDAREIVLGLVRPGDLVLTIGAGDITRLGQELVDGLQRGRGDGGDSDGPNAP